MQHPAVPADALVIELDPDTQNQSQADPAPPLTKAQMQESLEQFFEDQAKIIGVELTKAHFSEATVLKARQTAAELLALLRADMAGGQ